MEPDIIPLDGTLDRTAAGERLWDLIVVGAGPAGAVAAREAARAGLSTLLVERHQMPRSKVCGGCLNRTAVEALTSIGLDTELARCGGHAVDRIRLHHRARQSTIAIPEGVSVTRFTLDRMLVEAAIAAGAQFLPETTALIQPDPAGVLPGSRTIDLRSRSLEPGSARGRVVVVADGLGHPSLRLCREFASVVDARSRIGAGVVAQAGFLPVEPGMITMTVGAAGYVGAVLAEADRVNLAAALDPALVKSRGSVGGSVAAVFLEAGLEVPAGLDDLEWRGTPPLTQRTLRPVGHRLIVIGDASGYVEPFTGEGMAWAITTSLAVVPLVQAGVAAWDGDLESRWLSTRQDLLGPQQRACGWLTRALRSPVLVGAGVQVTSRWPGLARPIVARLGH